MATEQVPVVIARIDTNQVAVMNVVPRRRVIEIVVTEVIEGVRVRRGDRGTRARRRADRVLLLMLPLPLVCLPILHTPISVIFSLLFLLPSIHS